MPGPVAVPVVFDVNVLVLAVAVGESPFRSWPSPPPTPGNPSADCLGVVNDAAEFALWLSPQILPAVCPWDTAARYGRRRTGLPGAVLAAGGR